MTDRHAGYVVTLEKDIREDDAEALMTALTALRGVIRVEPVISSADVHIAQARAETEIHGRLFKAIYKKDD